MPKTLIAWRSLTLLMSARSSTSDRDGAVAPVPADENEDEDEDEDEDDNDDDSGGDCCGLLLLLLLFFFETAASAAASSLKFQRMVRDSGRWRRKAEVAPSADGARPAARTRRRTATTTCWRWLRWLRGGCWPLLSPPPLLLRSRPQPPMVGAPQEWCPARLVGGGGVRAVPAGPDAMGCSFFGLVFPLVERGRALPM